MSLIFSRNINKYWNSNFFIKCEYNSIVNNFNKGNIGPVKIHLTFARC